MPIDQSSVFSRQSSEKKLSVDSHQSSVFSRQSSVRKQIQKLAASVHCPLPTAYSSQAGVAQLALVLLLLAGVAVGTYVVQHRTNVSPNAEEGGSCNDDTYYCEGDKKIHKTGGYQDDNGECVYDYQDAGSCEDGSDNNNESGNNSCNEDTTYCDNGKKIHKTGGYWDGSQCVYDFKNEGSCGGSSNEKENSDQKSNQSDNQKNSGGQSDGSNSSNTSYDQGDCRDGAQVYKDGYTWITYCTKVCSKNSDCPKNTTDGAVNPETSNWCYGFNGGKAPRCMMLVQSDNKEVTDTNRKTTNSKAVEEIKATIDKGGDPNPEVTEANQSSSVELKAKVEAQNKQRGDLLNELATVLNNGGSNTLTAEVNKAQNLLNTAAGNAVNCYTGHDKPLSDSCDATAQAANDIAVAASRVALFDAVAAGVPNTCVKVDMAVGENTSNSLIEVAPADNPGSLSRLFMCRGAESSNGKKDGEIKWRVRDTNGSLQEVSAASLAKYNLKTNQKDVSTVPSDFVTRRNNAAALSSQPNYTAPASINFSETSNNVWKEVPVSICRDKCSNFPVNSVCYQRGSTDQYNCAGQSLNALCPGGVCP